MNNAADRLYRTLADVFGTHPDTLSDTSSPDTVSAWDSLNHLNLVMALESEFAIRLSPDDAVDMRNIGLIRTILREQGVDV
jgi:acyl carrier protein